MFGRSVGEQEIFRDKRHELRAPGPSILQGVSGRRREACDLWHDPPMKLFLGVLLAAAQGAVPVINYRLGIFGFLAHPAKESLRKKWIDFMSDFDAGLRSRAAAGASR